MKSYVRNTINLSCAKILLTSVIGRSDVEVSDAESEELLCDDRLILGHDYV